LFDGVALIAMPNALPSFLACVQDARNSCMSSDILLSVGKLESVQELHYFCQSIKPFGRIRSPRQPMRDTYPLKQGALRTLPVGVSRRPFTWAQDETSVF